MSSSPKRPADPAATSDAAPLRSAEVVLDVDVEHDRVHLVLANCGDAVATDVQVEFSRGLLGIAGSVEISALPVFKRLGVLRPGKSIRIFWDAAPALLADPSQAGPFAASVSWNERGRPRQRAEYQHDLSVFKHLPSCVQPQR
jgi:hypothetical protein